MRTAPFRCNDDQTISKRWIAHLAWPRSNPSTIRTGCAVSALTRDFGRPCVLTPAPAPAPARRQGAENTARPSRGQGNGVGSGFLRMGQGVME
jgi:hypothetical protein